MKNHHPFSILLLILLIIPGNEAFCPAGVKSNKVLSIVDSKRTTRVLNVHKNDDDQAVDSTNNDLINRRGALIQSASVVASSLLVASGSMVPSAAYADDKLVELIVSQQRLLEGLSAAPLRHIVITGANSGVGLAGAKLLTAAGHRVTLACRTQAKADAAAEKCREYAASAPDKFFKSRREGGIAVGAECDLASMASIRSFAKSLQQKSKDLPIDSLVLNAGLAHGQNDATVYRTADGLEETIGVNHLGHFLLANLMAPTLEANNKKTSRLVLTASPVHDPTSGGGDVGLPASLGTLQGMSGKDFEMVDGGAYNADKAYKDSKLCNILFMEEAARRYNGKFTVNAFSPGLIADPNGFFRNQNKGFSTIFNTITKVVGVAESNEFGGSALAYMAVDPSVSDQSGGWYDSSPPGKHQLSKHDPSVEAQNINEQKQLWDLSTKLVGL